MAYFCGWTVFAVAMDKILDGTKYEAFLGAVVMSIGFTSAIILSSYVPKKEEFSLSQSKGE